MGSVTPGRNELAQKIRSASARLRSPCRPRSLALDHSKERGPVVGKVDLSALRAQLEHSLARLQASDSYDKSIGAGSSMMQRSTKARSDVWERNALLHWDGRRRRKLARAALLLWRHLLRDNTALAELQGQIENAHMQLSVYRDPARTQVTFLPHMQHLCRKVVPS